MKLLRWARRRVPKNNDGAKIFGIGHGRTGTRTLIAAAKILGYELMHKWDEFSYDELNEKDGGADSAFAAVFFELDRKYPGSKFIYTNRALEAWLDSYKRRDSHKTPGEVGSPLYNIRVQMYGYDLGRGYEEELLIAAFARHQARVLEHFKDRPDDLLIINITDGEGWEKLCPFLNEPIPDVDFPHKTDKKMKGAWRII